METRTQTLKTLLEKYKGKKILIICNNSYKYKTDDLKIFDECVSFIDKYGSDVLISFEQIASVQEVQD